MWILRRTCRVWLLLLLLLGGAQPAWAVIIYDTWATGQLTLTNLRLFNFHTGDFSDIPRPSDSVLDVTGTSLDNLGAAGTFQGEGQAHASNSGDLLIEGSTSQPTGLLQTAAAQGEAWGTGAQAQSFHSTTGLFELFFNPLADTSGFFADGDVLAVDFLFDYALEVAAFKTHPDEVVDAVATVSLFSFNGLQTFEEVVGEGFANDPEEEFGIDFFLSEQIFGGESTLALDGQMSFSLLLDSWFQPADGLIMQVDVDGGGTAVPLPATAWLFVLGLFLLALQRRSGAYPQGMGAEPVLQRDF